MRQGKQVVTIKKVPGKASTNLVLSIPDKDDDDTTISDLGSGSTSLGFSACQHHVERYQRTALHSCFEPKQDELSWGKDTSLFFQQKRMYREMLLLLAFFAVATGLCMALMASALFVVMRGSHAYETTTAAPLNMQSGQLRKEDEHSNIFRDRNEVNSNETTKNSKLNILEN